MKHLIIIALLLTQAIIFAQTPTMERQALNEAFKAGKLNQTEVQARKKILDGLVADGFFQSLPMDTNTMQFQLNTIMVFPGMSKHDIFLRIKEWCAISFGNINEVMHYSNEETGKIIVKGFSPLSYKTTYTGWFGIQYNVFSAFHFRYTIMFTIKDGKVKMEYLSPAVEVLFNPQTQTVTTVQNQPQTINFAAFFPIILTEQGGINGRANMLKDIFEEMKNSREGLNRYVSALKSDYGF